MRYLKRLMFSVHPVSWFAAGVSTILFSLFFSEIVITIVGLIYFFISYYQLTVKIKSYKEVMVARIHNKVWSCRKDYETNEYVWHNKTDEHRFPAEEYDQHQSEEELRQLIKWVTPLKVFKKK